MKFDIAICFMPVSPSGTVFRGCISSEPLEGTVEEAEQARNALQSQINKMSYISIFTRNNEPVIGHATGEELPAEITLGEKVLAHCIMISQIVVYKD